MDKKEDWPMTAPIEIVQARTVDIQEAYSMGRRVMPYRLRRTRFAEQRDDEGESYGPKGAQNEPRG